ncbi:MAG: LysM peptidoglycan-binding domain-containing protein [Hyphomicrobiales bacterium]
MLLAAAIGITAAGCGKPVLRVADASLGDYYTPEEFKRLRQEQRDEYCNELALQDSTYRDEIREAKDALAALELRRAPLARAADSLAARADSLSALVAAAPPAPVATSATGAATHRVLPGESLWRISRQDDVYGAGHLWRRLYDANRDRIGNPDLIHPGQEIRIPR